MIIEAKEMKRRMIDNFVACCSAYDEGVGAQET